MVKELKRIQYRGGEWYVDGRLGQIRQIGTEEFIDFDDLEEGFDFEAIMDELYQYYNR